MSLASPPDHSPGSVTSPTSASAAAAAAASAAAAAASRTQRCGVCEGCLAKACGSCVYCKDNPQFGGPGVKKQSCLARRCVRVLEAKLLREAMGSRFKKGCGECDECRGADCEVCLVCLDKRFFEGRFSQNALCAKKKCSTAKPVDANPLLPTLASSINAASISPDKKFRPHPQSFVDGSTIPGNLTLNGGSPRKTHAGHFPNMFAANEMKKRKLDSTTNQFHGGMAPSTSNASGLRPQPLPPQSMMSSPSNFAHQPHQHQPQQSSSSDGQPATLMERAFSYVIQQPPPQPPPSIQHHHQQQQHHQQLQHQPRMPQAASSLRHPSAILVQGASSSSSVVVIQPGLGPGNGASPPAGTTAPVYHTLPVAISDNTHVTWNPQTAKVLYPTSVEPFVNNYHQASMTAVPFSSTSAQHPHHNEGYIVTLDGDQLKQHLSGGLTTSVGAPWPTSNSMTVTNASDSEDIEFQQKLIDFYQRDKQSQHHSYYQSNQYGASAGGILSNQGQYLGGGQPTGQTARHATMAPSNSALPPSIVAEPIAPMGQSEVVLQQL